MKIYISLPITGREAAAREHADNMKAMLSRNGYEVFVANRFNIKVFFEEYINGKNMYALECKGY